MTSTLSDSHRISKQATLAGAGDSRTDELLRGADRAVIATDLEGRVILWNRAAEKLYGWTEAEVLGRNILDVTPTPDAATQAARIFESLRAGQSWTGNFSVRRKDGHWFSVHVTDIPVRNKTGELEAVMGLSEPVEASSSGSLLDWIIPLVRQTDRESLGSDELQRTAPHRFFEREHPWTYASAILLLAVALGARILLDLVIPGEYPFITFFAAVLIGSTFLGFGPSLLLLFGSAVVAAWWQPAPLEVRALGAFIFLLVGGSLVGVVTYLVGLHAELRTKDTRLALINRELRHRLKNVFAVTGAICLQTLKNSGAPERIADVLLGRIRAVATSLDLVGAAEASSLSELITKIVVPISPTSGRLHITGGELLLPEESTTPFALILHELATNALKHGAWALDQGEVTITWKRENGELRFDWIESRTEPISPPVRQGVGTTLIRRGLPNATVTQDFPPSGLVCRIVLPMTDSE